MIRWSLNISTLLREYPFLERFKRAADLGFKAVEFWWPTGIDLDALIRACEAACVSVAVLNTDGGNAAAGERGFLGNPAKANDLRANFILALDLATALDCKLINLLGGTLVPGMTREAQLAEAAQMQAELCALAAARDVTVTLEPQNCWDAPHYLFTTSAQGIAQINAVGAANLKLQYDVYHMQRMEGRITDTLHDYIEQIAHIQIADVPGRNQPHTGELNYPFILREIQLIGYDGYVGLEYYAPGGDTLGALSWLPKTRRATYNAV
ncbi:MAG: TIM barrel protein [Chloroflexota bacterium]